MKQPVGQPDFTLTEALDTALGWVALVGPTLIRTNNGEGWEYAQERYDEYAAGMERYVEAITTSAPLPGIDKAAVVQQIDRLLAQLKLTLSAWREVRERPNGGAGAFLDEFYSQGCDHLAEAVRTLIDRWLMPELEDGVLEVQTYLEECRQAGVLPFSLEEVRGAGVRTVDYEVQWSNGGK